MPHETLENALKSAGIPIAPNWDYFKTQRDGSAWVQSFQAHGHQVVEYGDWSTRSRGEWSTPGAKENQEFLGALIAVQKEKQKRIEEGWELARMEAEKLWEDASDRGDHKYLTEKQIPELYGARIHVSEKGRILLVPMRDLDGKLWNLTRIYEVKLPQGNKFLLKGGRKDGLFHTLQSGDIDPTAPRILCEGFSTAASVAQIVGVTRQVIACFDAGNLVKVAEELAGRGISFDLAADHDRWKDRVVNPGFDAALEAQGFCPGARIYLPAPASPGTDWNDLHLEQGLEACRKAFVPWRKAERNEGQGKAEEKAAPLTKEEKKKSAAQKEEAITRALFAQFKGRIIKQDQDIFLFDAQAQHWIHLDKRKAADHFLRFIDAMNGKELKMAEMKAIWERFQIHVPSKPDDRNMFAPPPYVVNFSNGALELNRGEDGKYSLKFREKRQDDLLLGSHSFPYRADAPLNPEFEAAVERVLGTGEARDVYFEVLGATLMPAFPKVVFFIGPPGTGKSTLILFAKEMISPDLQASVDPSDWIKFGMTTLAGKLVNLSPDISLSKPMAEHLFKQIEDRIPVRIERKNLGDIYAPLPAVHLFGANGLPRTKEDVAAFKRRVIILNCDRYHAPDTGYTRDFAALVWNAGQGGIVRRAIEGLHRLVGTGGHYSAFQDSSTAMETWRKTAEDDVAAFLRECREGDVVLSGTEVKCSTDRANLDENDTESWARGEISGPHLWILFCHWFETNAPRSVPPKKRDVLSRLKALGIESDRNGGRRFYRGFHVGESPSSTF